MNSTNTATTSQQLQKHTQKAQQPPAQQGLTPLGPSEDKPLRPNDLTKTRHLGAVFLQNTTPNSHKIVRIGWIMHTLEKKITYYLGNIFISYLLNQPLRTLILC